MNSMLLEDFWSAARSAVPELPVHAPQPWAFGATPEHADDLLALVLDGTKTGTASALCDIEAEGEEVPRVGEVSIILDGRDSPRAVIETTAVVTVAFDEVTAEHAHAEGEANGPWRPGGRSTRGSGETTARAQRVSPRICS